MGSAVGGGRLVFSIDRFSSSTIHNLGFAANYRLLDWSRQGGLVAEVAAEIDSYPALKTASTKILFVPKIVPILNEPG